MKTWRARGVAGLVWIGVLCLALGLSGCADDRIGQDGGAGSGANSGSNGNGANNSPNNGGQGSNSGTGGGTNNNGGTGSANSGTGGTNSGTGGTNSGTGGTNSGTGGTNNGSTGTNNGSTGTNNNGTSDGGCVDTILEPCDGLDNNCNGTVDEGCSCAQAEQACYTGPPNTVNVGICRQGTQRCESEFYGDCTGDTLPEVELCDGIDNDCDGQVDEGYDVGTSCNGGEGTCASQGLIRCDAAGTGVFCDAVDVTPGDELCDGLDNDCDGQIDEDFTDLGSPCSEGLGLCANNGAIVCSADGAGTVCNAQPFAPATERCDGLDNNCNGQVDETFTTLGQACEAGVGACARPGTWICGPDGLEVVCNGSPGAPSAEVCDGIDNDCNGQVDELPECSNSGPVVVCPQDVSVATLETAVLTAQATDPDGDPMTYRWELLEAPIGSGSAPTPTNALTTNLWMDIAGDFVLRFTATDSNGVASSCETTARSVPSEQFRVELLWNVGVADDTSDVDLHLLRKDSGGNWFDGDWDCYYANCNSSSGANLEWGGNGDADNPRLDVDDVQGNGPENINIDDPEDRTYRIGVHYYSADQEGDSSVIVRVYCNAQLVREFEPVTLSAPGSSNDNDFWIVGDVVWDGAVCQVQELGSAGNRDIVTASSARNRQ